MQPTTKYTAGVIGIINRAKAYNGNIGAYAEHYINDNFQFAVRLSNKGAITMSMEIAQDQEADSTSISEDRIQAVAATFRNIP